MGPAAARMLMASLLMTHAAGGLLLFNLRPDHVVSCAPIHMAEPSEFQTSQAVSYPVVGGRRGVICAIVAFGTMAGTAAAMADETDEQQSIEAEAAR